MPFVEEDMDNFVDDVPIPQIGTDLFGGYNDEEPLDSGPAISENLEVEVEAEAEAEAEAAETVVHPDNDADEEEDQNGISDVADSVPMEEDEAPAPVSAKKRGRPSASRTSTPAKTPKSAKNGAASSASSGRKRRAVDTADEPPVKRSSRATAVAAQDAIKEVSKKRPRAAPGSAKPKAAPKKAVAKQAPAAKQRPGMRPKKTAVPPKKKASPVKAAGRAGRRGPGRPKKN
ncbi:hypothetical protein VM1G_05989 [Cytospora mali]|uniref:Uncharacterized protein n=1 Tax=Cytospora mali TaxID=578113 RepID=A0A194W416_CYTMA|nr:hypothetical protein VM1G_05989 [Valsa mali]